MQAGEEPPLGIPEELRLRGQIAEWVLLYNLFGVAQRKRSWRFYGRATG